MSTSGGSRAVVAALAANLGIAVTKFVAFAFTGSSSMLAEAVHTVAGGKKFLSPAVAQDLALLAVSSDKALNNNLSAREFEVLRLLLQGHSINDIARALGINRKTVSNHQTAVKQKLGADTAIQLLKIASRLGLESRN